MTTSTAFKPAAISADMITETGPHTFVVDASDLRWPAGIEWPATIETTMGNGLRFQLWSASRDHATYRQANGIIVVSVFND
jgi:hypothetical protein